MPESHALPPDLNHPNRRMRTRMSGGVGGEQRATLPPIPIPLRFRFFAFAFSLLLFRFRSYIDIDIDIDLKAMTKKQER